MVPKRGYHAMMMLRRLSQAARTSPDSTTGSTQHTLCIQAARRDGEMGGPETSGAIPPRDQLSYRHGFLGAPHPSLSTAAARAWPGARLAHVPSREIVPRLVGQVCEWWGVLGPDPLDPEAVFDALGWPVVAEPLGAVDGSHQAMLIPRLAGGFTVLVDPDLTPDERGRGARPANVKRARLAHELAHSFFYSDGAPSTRLMRWAPGEEVFCDRFASAIAERDWTKAQASASSLILS